MAGDSAYELRQQLARLIELASSALEDAFARRTAVLAEVRQAEARIVQLAAERCAAEDALREARTQMDQLLRDLETLRVQRVGVLLSVEGALTDALALREQLHDEITRLRAERASLDLEAAEGDADPAMPLDQPGGGTGTATEEARATREAPADQPVSEPSRDDAARAELERTILELVAEPAAVPLPAESGPPERAAARRVSGGWLSTVVTGALLLLLVGLAVLMTPLPELFGWQLYAVQSGSMAPAIPVGSAVGVRQVPAEQLVVGNIITFRDDSRPDTIVTHRIIALEPRAGQLLATTKGDANNTADARALTLQGPVARVERVLPLAGYAMVWFSAPLVRIGVLAAAFAALALLSVRQRHAVPAPGSGRPARGAAAPSFEHLSQQIDTLLVSPRR